MQNGNLRNCLLGPLSPLLSNLYLTRIDYWMFEKARLKTQEKGYDEINYHRWADDIVILVNPHSSKEWIVNRAHQRLALPVISEEVANMIMDNFLNAIPQPIKQQLLLAA